MDQKPSPITAIESAWKDMVAVLFAPFNFTRWLILGIPLFMINCGSGGGNFNFNINTGGGPGGGPGQPGAEPFADVVQWIDQNIGMLTVLVLVLVVILVITLLIVAYLQSRGIFMLVDMLSTESFTLRSAWDNSTRAAHSFFLYQIVLYVVMYAFPIFYLLVVLGWPFLRGFLLGESGWWDFFSAMGVVLLYYVLVCLPVLLLNALVRNFSVPIMASTGLSLIPATRQAFALFFSALGSSLLFMLLLFLMGIGSSVVVGFVGCLLVCVLVGCIPIVGQYAMAVATAPVWIFLWCLSLRFVEQFGAQYRVLPEALGQLPDPPIAPFHGDLPPPPTHGHPPAGPPPSWPPAPMPPPLPPPEGPPQEPPPRQ